MIKSPLTGLSWRTGRRGFELMRGQGVPVCGEAGPEAKGA